ncbi:hypothetical protein HWV23_04760 [Natronomonas halophila]|uniref:FxLYD domain-containing protein n=1 Tax=Natronomonas halophila TaxID=2747817 RepID=UPI0015B57A95|nr:FxLYD domain-containing protein [Natronomonas halophila]QLD85060.1 hypothetical protein HWV23_04760 [Natronomonas halophila]
MFVTTVVSGVAMTVMAGCTESGDTASGGNGNADGGEATDTNTQQQTSTSTPESDEPAVKILDHSMEYDEMMGVKVVGTVKNTTDSEQGYIQVKARFFDESDTRVGEGMWNATDVSAGREVQFETIPAQVDSEPARYEVETSTSPS